MRNIIKIILTAIILAIFCCNVSFAAGLGEKKENTQFIVVAIYNGEEYTADGVFQTQLLNGQVLPWSQWTSQDLITIYNRCASGALKYFPQNFTSTTGAFKKDQWYINFWKEFLKRQENGQIVRVGELSSSLSETEDGSGFDEDGNIDYNTTYEFKVAEDMTEDDKDRAEEEKKKTEQEIAEYKNYEVWEIINYLKNNNYKCPNEHVSEIWEKKIREALDARKDDKDSSTFDMNKKVYEKTWNVEYEGKVGSGSQQADDEDDGPPSQGPSTVDDVIKGAQDFLKEGSKRQILEDQLQSASDFIFNILLGIAMILAVIIGTIIGIKFMVASVEEKAKVKEAIVPYFVGCAVVFGAFGIWKLVVIILSSM